METDRLILRNFEMNDAEECFHNFGQDSEIGKYIITYPVASLSVMQDLVEGFSKNPNMWLIQEKKQGQRIGYISIDIEYEMLGIGEIGYLIGSNFQHKGYAKEALNKIIEYLFYERNLYMIEAKVNETNNASIMLLKKLGFNQDAVLRKRRIDLISGERNDLHIYSILKDEMIKE